MAGGGGAWKVAYADFVTAMMAFFMVMWLVGQKKDVKEAIAHHFNHPFEPFEPSEPSDLPGFSGGPSARGQMKTPVGYTPKPNLTKSNQDPEASKPRVLKMRESDTTGIGSVVFFDELSAELDSTAKERLTMLVPLLVGKPQKIEIRGHTSRRPMPADSAYQDGWQLSYARSLAVMKFLEQQGIPLDRIRLSQAGGFEPYTTREDAAKQALNPRVEIFMLSEYAEDLNGTREERGQRFQSE